MKTEAGLQKKSLSTPLSIKRQTLNSFPKHLADPVPEELADRSGAKYVAGQCTEGSPLSSSAQLTKLSENVEEKKEKYADTGTKPFLTGHTC